MPRLAVLADSLAFHGPEGPVPLADPRLYHRRAAARLARATGEDWDVAVWARAGWGLRETWLGLQKDVNLQQQILMGSAAVVLGTGTMDQASVAVPRWAMQALAFVRPVGLRRRVRVAVDRTHPAATRLTCGRWRYTPPSVVAHCFAKSVAALRLFAPDAALVCVLPAVHRAVYYGGVDRWHAVTHATMAGLAEAKGIAAVDLAPLSARHLHAYNPDGAHWGWDLHAEVGEALAAALLPQLRARGRVAPSTHLGSSGPPG